MPYRITVHDNGGTKTDTLFGATDISYVSIIRGTESIRFRLRRDDDQIPLVPLGTWVNVHNTDTDAVVAAGLVGTTLALPDTDFIQVNCIGLASILARFIYPPGYILSGTLFNNADRMVRMFDWRHVTSITPNDSGHDGREVCTFKGNQSGTGPGAFWKSFSGTLAGGDGGDVVAWEVHVDTDEGAAGIVTVKGTDSDSDGVFNNPDFAKYGVYEGPYLDCEPPDAISSNKHPAHMDRLRFGGAWNDDDEMKWSIKQYDSLSTARDAYSAGDFSDSTDPEGVGESLATYFGGNDVPTSGEQYFSVGFLMTHDNISSLAIGIMWYQLVFQHLIPGIQTGNVALGTTSWPNIDIEDNLEVGGQTLLDVLDRISEVYELEYRVRHTGEVDVQSRPRVDEWVLKHGSVTNGPFLVDNVITGAGSGAGATIKAVNKDRANELTISSIASDGVLPLFQGNEVINMSGGGSSTESATLPAAPVSHVGSVWGTDFVARYALQDGAHINIDDWSEDSSNLVNYLVAEGTGSGSNRSSLIKQGDKTLFGTTTTSQEKYGVRQKVVQFNKKSIADLNTEAAKYLFHNQLPIQSAKVTILDTPDHTYAFVPGDRIRVMSSRLTDIAGDNIDSVMRITRERRMWTETGEQVVLEMEKGTKTRFGFARTLVKTLSGIRQAMDRSLTHYATGIIDTEDITPPEVNPAGKYTLRLEFTPTEVAAHVIEVEDQATGNWYTASSGPFMVDIVKAIPGNKSAFVQVMKVDGTDKVYRARIKWEAWGNRLNDLPRAQ